MFQTIISNFFTWFFYHLFTFNPTNIIVVYFIRTPVFLLVSIFVDTTDLSTWVVKGGSVSL